MSAVSCIALLWTHVLWANQIVSFWHTCVVYVLLLTFHLFTMSSKRKLSTLDKWGFVSAKKACTVQQGALTKKTIGHKVGFSNAWSSWQALCQVRAWFFRDEEDQDRPLQQAKNKHFRLPNANFAWRARQGCVRLREGCQDVVGEEEQETRFLHVIKHCSESWLNTELGSTTDNTTVESVTNKWFCIYIVWNKCHLCNCLLGKWCGDLWILMICKLERPVVFWG